MTRFITSDGLSLEYRDEGRGIPLLCLPGLTRNSVDFDDLAAALDGRHRMIRLTSRGRGDSDRDPQWRNYTIPVEAADALAFLDHLGLERAVIAGTSRGGQIAMHIAATAPERLAGVLLNDIGPELAPEGLAQIMSYLGVTPQVPGFREAAVSLKSRLGADFPGLSDARWLQLARRWFDAGQEGGLKLNYDARLRDAAELVLAKPLPDLWPLFDALQGVPLALVRGANSNLLSASTAAEMQARRPDMIFAEVPDRGHVPFLDEPQALAALDRLLAKIAP